MGPALSLALAGILVMALGLAMPTDLRAQTKDDTVVYALQSDVDNWDPPNSVLREAIILGYHVFDHLAVYSFRCGSSQSRSAFPMRLMTSVVTKMASPGKAAIHQEFSM
jgi:hypothetical protein